LKFSVFQFENRLGKNDFCEMIEVQSFINEVHTIGMGFN